MAKLSKSQFYATLTERTGLQKKDVKTLADALTQLVYDEVRSSGEITIPGLGKLVKKDRAARMGRNPATGESIQIAAKTVVKFRVAKAAKDAIL